MIDGKTVNENEHGLVRVFKADPQLAMEIGQSGTYERLCRTLGIDRIDAEDVQQLPTHTLEGMTVTDFLRAGYDVRDEDVADNRSALNRLDAFEGMLLLIRSGAFPDRPVTLNADGEAKLIATLREPDADVSFEALPNPDPHPDAEEPPKKKPSDAAMSGRVATIVLIVMAILVIAMIWLAG